MIPEMFDHLVSHVCIEVGIFAANLTNYLLSNGLDMSYNLCFSKDLNKWHEYGFTHMQSPPVLMMSAGYRKETRHERLNKKEIIKKYPDTKPDLEEIIYWRNNKKLD